MIKVANDDHSDSEMWDAFKAGDREAFEMIYNDSVKYLTNYALRIVSDKDLVQDSIQDVFVNLWNKRERLSSISSIRFYLLKTIRRDVIAKVARRNKKSPLSALSGVNLDFQPSYEMMTVSDEESTERIMKIRRELDLLTSRQKEVLYLKYYSNMTNQEISELLEINMQSVYNNIYRALEVLRGKFHIILPLFTSGMASEL